MRTAKGTPFHNPIAIGKDIDRLQLDVRKRGLNIFQYTPQTFAANGPAKIARVVREAFSRRIHVPAIKGVDETLDHRSAVRD
jgi:hypothetical protein